VEGVFAGALVGIGTDGVVVNYGQVDSVSDGGPALQVIGDQSQAINAGQLTANGNGGALNATGAGAEAINTGVVKGSGANTDMLHVRGEGAVGLNLGRIFVNGPNIAGMAGVATDTRLTNNATIIVTADGGSFGMGGFGDGHQVNNFGLIETHGT